jgi:aspartyl-tRNA(Asn)/glutamyl-tRNA(Gln) amidotransferase subunit A
VTAARDAVAIAESVGRREVGALELIGAAADAARRSSGDNSFWARDEEGELEAARTVDRSLADAPLAGVAVAVKDCIDVAGLPTTGGVRRPTGPAAEDAVVVRRLRRAGAVPFGKTAMDQLAWTVHGRAPGFPPCRNPGDPRLSPGGSSCGSAAAVAAGVTPLALGTDIAGSVRIPAAHCGVVGFKPAPPPVPLEGCMRFAPSFELVGVIGRSVRDCARAYEVLAGESFVRDGGQPARLTLLDDLFEEADPATAAVCEELTAAVDRTGERLDWRPSGFGRVLAAELARTWGDAVDREPALFTEDVRRSVAFGRELDDGSYCEALDSFTRACRDAAGRLSMHEVVASPTVPGPVPLAGDPPDVGRDTRFTRIFSALGWAAVSLPAGHDSDGRPVGLQLAASPGREAALFAVAAALERAR